MMQFLEFYIDLSQHRNTCGREAHAFVDKSRVIDDTTLDKPYASKLVSYHWSGKHHRVVKGINLQSLIWTDGDQLIPIDYSLYDKAKTGMTKNDHFRAG